MANDRVTQPATGLHRGKEQADTLNAYELHIRNFGTFLERGRRREDMDSIEPDDVLAFLARTIMANEDVPEPAMPRRHDLPHISAREVCRRVEFQEEVDRFVLRADARRAGVGV